MAQQMLLQQQQFQQGQTPPHLNGGHQMLSSQRSPLHLPAQFAHGLNSGLSPSPAASTPMAFTQPGSQLSTPYAAGSGLLSAAPYYPRGTSSTAPGVNMDGQTMSSSSTAPPPSQEPELSGAFMYPGAPYISSGIYGTPHMASRTGSQDIQGSQLMTSPALVRHSSAHADGHQPSPCGAMSGQAYTGQATPYGTPYSVAAGSGYGSGSFQGSPMAPPSAVWRGQYHGDFGSLGPSGTPHQVQHHGGPRGPGSSAHSQAHSSLSAAYNMPQSAAPAQAPGPPGWPLQSAVGHR
eukprot:TRINITY_DN61545_c0_g1_i6.p1 TRINITY_DN61545_c0_g1~~TRINITY_DN61545_c0_g1_i6.p1  ORF type:complete len:292 (+),score=26.20 TRINITY_DN61545_c0_g1_i6:3-878(+)